MNTNFLSQFYKLNTMVKFRSDFILLLFCTILLNACQSDLEKCQDNPDCTYFVCKVNGEDWGINCEGDPLFGCSAIDVQYYKKSGNIELHAVNGNKDQVISIFSHELHLGENKFYSKNTVNTEFGNGKNENKCVLSKIDTLTPSAFFIDKIDTIKFRIKGSFFLECKNECNNIVKITDGQFHVGYRF